MQLTPKVDVQIDGYGARIHPGETITGAVLVTSESQTSITKAAVYVRSVVSFPKRRRRRRHKVVKELPTTGQTTGQTSHKEIEHGNARENAHKSSKGPNLEVRVQSSKPEATWKEHKAEHTQEYTSEYEDDHGDWETEVYQHSQEILKTERVPLLKAPKKVKPGITVLKFEIVLPKVFNGEELLPTLLTKSGNAEVQVYYELVAAVNTPAPILSSLSLPLVSHNRIIVVNPPDKQRSGLFQQLKTVEANTKVGFWTKESMSWRNLFRYMVGYDTAKSWTPVGLKVRMPLAISVVDTLYLQDKMRITLVLPDGRREKQIADKQIADKHISVKEISKKYNEKHEDEDITRLDAADNYDVSFCIKSVAVNVLTSVVVGFTANRDTMWVEEKIFEPQGFSFYPALNKGENDITALISGAKLTSSVPPTTEHSELQISHWIRVKVVLAALTQDGTSQVEAEVSVNQPISINSSPS